MAQKAPVTLDWSRNAACGNAPGAPQPVRPVVGDHKISSDQQEHQEQQEQPEQILQQIPQPPPPAMCHDLGLPMDDVSLEEFSNTYYRISDSIDVDMVRRSRPHRPARNSLTCAGQLVAQTPQYAHSYLDNHTSESDDGTSSSAEVQTRIHDSLVIEQDPRGSPIPCSCVRSLTSQVQYLHMWSRHCSTAGLDRMLQCTQQTTSCVMGFLKCPVCAFDVQPFFLVIMVLSLTLDLILPLIDPTRVGPRPMVQIRFGDFDVSAGLGKMLEKVAVRSYLGSLKAVVDRLDSKVDFVASDPAHVEFLRYEARRLKRGFYTIADQIEVSETE